MRAVLERHPRVWAVPAALAARVAREPVAIAETADLAGPVAIRHAKVETAAKVRRAAQALVGPAASAASEAPGTKPMVATVEREASVEVDRPAYLATVEPAAMGTPSALAAPLGPQVLPQRGPEEQVVLAAPATPAIRTVRQVHRARLVELAAVPQAARERTAGTARAPVVESPARE